MAFLSGKSAKALVNEFDLSAYFNSCDIGVDVAALETTAFGKTSRNYLAGLKNGTVSLAGYWDGAASAVDVVLAASLGASAGRVVTFGSDRLTVGKRVKLVSGKTTSYRVSTPVDGVVAVSADLQADNGVDHGHSHHALASEGATGSSASVDGLAGSTNGGVANLHVTVNIRSANSTFKIQDSANDIAWADLITFAVVATTVVTSEQATVAGDVDRYTRGDWTYAAGTGADTFALAFARR